MTEAAPPFSKILIANRGEIAVRIAGTCRAMGICSAAVYSTADDEALHTQVADEAYEIGPAPAIQSYLHIASILEAARQAGADAIHPGYGFLAENATFAQAVCEAGMVWIGPPASVIELLGDKVAAKRLAQEAGIPVVPGYSGVDQSFERLKHEADLIGYPIMLKAAAGGGGRGMRSVANSTELAAALEGARREARAAFGDDRIFLEKRIEAPRHVEFQILIDGDGAGVSLGERDCSLQRRHQKVVEEAPCPVLSPEFRDRMGSDALRLMLTAGYRNAGTVEFLLDRDRYYFLEVNTRIQVEHPVTEMVTGLDLIRLQIEIAAGRPIGLVQEQVQTHGHAFEARLYAEDPDADFVPSTGKLRSFLPFEGPGIRNDLGVYQGFDVSQYYDPMLAKLIVHGETRADALGILQRALANYEVAGPKTNRPFLTWLVSRAEIVAGDFNIEYIDRTWQGVQTQADEIPMGVLAAAALSVTCEPGVTETGPPDVTEPFNATSNWRSFGIQRRLLFAAETDLLAVELTARDSGAWTIVSADRSIDVSAVLGRSGSLVLRTGNRNEAYQVNHLGRRVEVSGASGCFTLTLTDVDSRPISVGKGHAGNRPSAPMPGTVVKVAVAVGESVVAHDTLVVLEAMKMEHVIEAPRAGIVTAVLVSEGELVAAGAEVVELDGQ